ncbi:MAG: hypothetical protein WAL50_05255 [Kineosporiaceae bacterium]
MSRTLDALGCLLVLIALLAPNRIGDLRPAAFLRLPVEALVGVALILAVPPRARRAAAALGGAALGVVTLVKALDLGFHAVLSRPVDPIHDWALLGPALESVRASAGRTGEALAVAGAVGVGAGVAVLLTLSVLRSTRLVTRHRSTAVRATAAASVVWIGCSVLGVQLAPRQPVAAAATVGDVLDHTRQVRDEWRSQHAFAADLAVDAARTTPSDRLLGGLRGKDVVVAFVESYGRDAVEDPAFSQQVGAVLDTGTRRLRAAGYGSRSAFLTSPVSGGGSWLAHATLLSGVWTDNAQRYQKLLASDHLTLNGAFKRAGWSTVGMMPGVIRQWPEGAFYDFDRVYDSRQLGYRGPRFTWARVPDQYTLSAFEHLEHAPAGRTPIMAEIPLVSSHHPWAPIPRMIGWDQLGDGSVFGPMTAAGQRPAEVWKDPARVRVEYRRSIEYSLSSLISYVQTYGDDDLVLVFVGDHQPMSLVTGDGASRDVPITIVARDRAVLDQISGWGWQDGLRPGPQAPVWRMNAFRDRFISAFSHPSADRATP